MNQRIERLRGSKQLAIYVVLIIVTSASIYWLTRSAEQTLAVTIFAAAVLGTLMFWKIRLGIAFVGLTLLLLTKTMDLPTAFDFMNTEVILFLVGMMVIFGMMRQSGFFTWMLVKVLRLSRFEPHWLLVILLILSSTMAALVDEVTSILFTTALVLDLCDHFGLNPTKYIISIVLATNIGSSWTVIGNPVGILIAFSSGFTFEDFIRSALPVGLVSLILLIGVILVWFRKDLHELRTRLETELYTGGIRHQAADAGLTFLTDRERIIDKKFFFGGITIFIATIASIAVSHRLELWLGLEPNTILFVTAILIGAVVLLWRRDQAREYVQRDVDWWTLIFFMFLFALAGCLQYVGITDNIATIILPLAQAGNAGLAAATMLWTSGLLSSITDNVVTVSALIPVAQALSAQLHTSTFWWALLFGGCYGGNLTMVGSTANIVALGMLERKSGHLISLGAWIKIGLLASLIPMAIGTVTLIVFG